MKTHVCQNCGALVRRLGSECSACGNVVTAHSSTGVTQLFSALAPNTVPSSTDPGLRKNMICTLHHALNPGEADCSTNPGKVGSQPVISPSVAAYVNEIGKSLNNTATAVIECVVEAEKSREEIVSKVAASAGDFFAETENKAAVIFQTHTKQEMHSRPESHSMPENRTVPESRPAQESRPAPEKLPVSENRSVPESRPMLESRLSSKSALEEITLKEAEHTEELMQRLVDANMSPRLPAESSFYDNVLNKAPLDEDLEQEPKQRPGKAPERKNKSEPFDLKALVFSPFQNYKALLLTLAVLLVCGIMSGYFWLLSQTSSGPDSLIGKIIAAAADQAPRSIQGNYSYWYREQNGDYNKGILSLHQNGSQISGDGSDFASLPWKANSGSTAPARFILRPFHIRGSYNAPNLKLAKAYPGTAFLIIYEGVAAKGVSGKIQLKGSWYFNAKTVLPESKLAWSADWDRKLRPPKVTWPRMGKELPGHAGDRAGSGDRKAGQDTAEESNWFKDLFWRDDEALAWKFIKILGACILFGIALVQVSLKFFGMHGLLNLWEREKYIPVAVKPQHLKLLKELGGAKKPGSLLLGERVESSWTEFYRPRKLYLPAARRERNPHILAMGAGAKGKTRLLASLIINDIKNDDRAVVVVDSEGSLVELITRWLGSCPEASKILQRVSIIDPCRSQCQLGFNPLAPGNAENLQAVASSVVMGFKSVYTESQNQQNQWTQQTANILRNAVLLLMLNERTLEDLPVLLSDNDFRDVLLEKVEKDLAQEWKTLIDAWSNYKRLARSEQWINWIEPILNRVQPLLSDQRISRLLNAKSNCVDLASLLEEKRILLVRVPEGQLEKGGNLMGSLLITGLRQAGLMHFERSGESGPPCSLYLDEMNNFIDAEAFEAICSDLRKVQIGIHATLKTLQDLNEEFRNRVTLNFGTLALFSVSKKDADILGPTMFRVDGRKIKKITARDVFNPINSTPNMDMATDEEKININRLVGQDERNYFCHLVGTEAGVFRIKAPEFNDIARGDVNWDLVETLYDNQEVEDEAG